MALIASLQFGDNESKRYSSTYTVCDVKCHMQRHHNAFQPDGHTQCERVDITVVAPGKEDLTLIEWYIKRLSMSGRVVIEMSGDANISVPASKEILFEDAVCFRMAEDYHIDNNRRRLLTLSFEADTLTLDNIVF